VTVIPTSHYAFHMNASLMQKMCSCFKARKPVKHCSFLVKECSFSRTNTGLAVKHSLKCPEECTIFNIEISHCEREAGVISGWCFRFLDTVVIYPKRILEENVYLLSRVFLYAYVRWNSSLIEDNRSFDCHLEKRLRTLKT